MFSNYYIVDVIFEGLINNELNNVYGQLLNSRNNINNLNQTGEVCLDDRLTFDVGVLKYILGKREVRHYFIISN